MSVPKSMYVIGCEPNRNTAGNYPAYALGSKTTDIYFIQLKAKRAPGYRVDTSAQSKECAPVLDGALVHYLEMPDSIRSNLQTALTKMIDELEKWCVQSIRDNKFPAIERISSDTIAQIRQHSKFNTFLQMEKKTGRNMKPEVVSAILRTISEDTMRRTVNIASSSSQTAPPPASENSVKQEPKQDGQAESAILRFITPGTVDPSTLSILKDYLDHRRSQFVKNTVKKGLSTGDTGIISLMDSQKVVDMGFQDIATKFEIIKLCGEKDKISSNLNSLLNICINATFDPSNQSIRGYRSKYSKKADIWLHKAFDVTPFYFDNVTTQYVMLAHCLAAAVLGNTDAQLLLSDLLLSDAFGGKQYAASAKWCYMAAEGGSARAKDKLDWTKPYTPIGTSFIPIEDISFSDRYLMIAELHLQNEFFLRGMYYEEGTRGNIEKAYECYSKAAESGYEPAKDKLDWSKDLGKDDEADFHKLRLCSCSGNPDVEYALAILYLEGRGTEPSIDKAGEYFAKALSKGHKATAEFLDWTNHPGQSNEVKFKKLQLAKHRGDRRATLEMARLYYYARGVKQDYEQAILHFTETMDLLEPEDRFCLAESLFKTGRFEEYPFEKLIGLYNDATNSGYGPAADRLDMSDLDSLNDIDAFYKRYLHKGDDDPENHYCLAHMYKSGNGVAPNDERYREYLLAAAEKDYVVAQLEEYEISPNNEKLGWLRRAASNGSIEALSKLGPDDAFTCCKAAAEKGIFSVFGTLAKYYEGGVGTTQSLGLALEWYRKAADAGDEYSIDRLDLNIIDSDPKSQFRKYLLAEADGKDVSAELSRCYAIGDGVDQNEEKSLQYLHESAEKGNVRSQVELAKRLESEERYHEALEWYRRAAELGDADSGEHIDLDHLTSLSDKKQFSNLLLYSEEGNPEVLYYLGRYTESGKGTRKNMTEAVSYINRAADLGNADAMYWMGQYCEIKHTKEHTYSKAVEWYTRASEAGKNEATEKIDWSRFDELSDEDKFSKCLLFSETNDAEKIYELGCCYLYGIGAPKNLSLAKNAFRKSDGLGHIKSRYALALTMEEDRDYTQAYTLFKDCQSEMPEAEDHITLIDLDSRDLEDQYRRCMLHSDEDNPAIHYRLGLFLEKGEVVTKDYEKSAQHFKKAIKLGHSEAKAHCDLSRLDSLPPAEQYDLLMLHENDGDSSVYYKLGQLHENRQAPESSANSAYEYYKKGANLCDVECSYRCGMMIIRKEVAGHILDAVKYLEFSESNGKVEARSTLGDLYMHKQKPDYASAAKWFRLAADCDDPYGQYMTGYLFEKGLGFPVFLAESVKWYTLATKNCNFDAKFRLAMLYYSGKGIKKSTGDAKFLIRDLIKDDSTRLTVLFDNEIATGNNDALSLRQELMV